MLEDALLSDLSSVSWLRDLGPVTVAEPSVGNFQLSVFPIKHDGSALVLPPGFEIWTDTVRAMLEQVPVQEGATNFYVTIDSRYFTQDGILRREGIHVDGNFCADPGFAPKTTWGPTPTPTWSGMLCISPIEMPDNSHVSMGWKIPYDIVIPIGQYVSGTRGGILAACSWVGCTAWPGVYEGEVLSGGALSEPPNGEPVLLPANRSIFMTSNTPHETMEVPGGVRRTLVRITMDCKYDNSVLRGVSTEPNTP